MYTFMSFLPYSLSFGGIGPKSWGLLRTETTRASIILHKNDRPSNGEDAGGFEAQGDESDELDASTSDGLTITSSMYYMMGSFKPSNTRDIIRVDHLRRCYTSSIYPFVFPSIMSPHMAKKVHGGSPRGAGELGEKRSLCTAFGPGPPGGSSESRDLRHGAIPGATPAAKRQGDRKWSK